MPYLLGTDEAGYGPNLGPLVISATLWRIPDLDEYTDLYARLNHVVSRVPVRRRESDKIAIADSKALYKSKSSLAQLELGVLSCLANCRGYACEKGGRFQRKAPEEPLGQLVPDIISTAWPPTWRELCRRVSPFQYEPADSIPWYEGYDIALPRDASVDELNKVKTLLRDGLAEAEVTTTLISMQSVLVYPQHMNKLIDDLGNKGAVLSKITLNLAKRVIANIHESSVLVICDKHGGRNRYGRLLQQTFPDVLVEVHGEGRQESIYKMGPASKRVEFQFRVGGESFLPSALASMISKYMRELSMLAFNDFWKARVPQLKPTAGYPVDARRFKKDIAAVQAKLGISDNVLWRKR